MIQISDGIKDKKFEELLEWYSLPTVPENLTVGQVLEMYETYCKRLYGPSKEELLQRVLHLLTDNHKPYEGVRQLTERINIVKEIRQVLNKN
jgi:hypothetical protein